jgi:hypothetical protein
MCDQSLLAHELLCLHLKAYYSLDPRGLSSRAAAKQLPGKKTTRKVRSTRLR